MQWLQLALSLNPSLREKAGAWTYSAVAALFRASRTLRVVFPMQPSASTAAPASTDIIRLNVGGTRLYTTRQTLLASSASQKPNFFHGLLSGRIGAALDETGAYFIDRDPLRFAHVLNYLRTGNWEGDNSKARTGCDEISREA